MARTWKDQPWRVVADDYANWRSYPPPHGGVYSGIGKYTSRWWRAERARIRRELHVGLEPDPSLPRHQEKWAYW